VWNHRVWRLRLINCDAFGTVSSGAQESGSDCSSTQSCTCDGCHCCAEHSSRPFAPRAAGLGVVSDSRQKAFCPESRQAYYGDMSEEDKCTVLDLVVYYTQGIVWDNRIPGRRVGIETLNFNPRSNEFEQSLGLGSRRQDRQTLNYSGMMIYA
jgi:hypothetical protein